MKHQQKLFLIVANILAISHCATIEVANLWLHHEMEPMELSHHFGVDSAHQVNPDMYQVIRINFNEGNDEEVSKRSRDVPKDDHSISIEAFGQKQKILLEKNSQLLSQKAKILVATESGMQEMPLPNNTDCHFLHSSEQVSAALSNCQGKEAYNGHLLRDGQIFEIKPLNSRVHGVLSKFHKLEEQSVWHIITRRPLSDLPDFDVGKSIDLGMQKGGKAKVSSINKRGGSDLTVETALFLDPYAYR